MYKSKILYSFEHAPIICWIPIIVGVVWPADSDLFMKWFMILLSPSEKSNEGLHYNYTIIEAASRILKR